MKKHSINEILNNPTILNSENCYGFYDWFCKDSSLKKKSESLIKKVKFLVDNGIIDGDKYSVWFKNNCPMDGSLYDDIRFNRMSDDEYIGGVCPSIGHKSLKGKCSYWLSSNDFEQVVFENWSTFKSEAKEKRVTIGG